MVRIYMCHMCVHLMPCYYTVFFIIAHRKEMTKYDLFMSYKASHASMNGLAHLLDDGAALALVEVLGGEVLNGPSHGGGGHGVEVLRAQAGHQGTKLLHLVRGVGRGLQP